MLSPKQFQCIIVCRVQFTWSYRCRRPEIIVITSKSNTGSSRWYTMFYTAGPSFILKCVAKHGFTLFMGSATTNGSQKTLICLSFNSKIGHLNIPALLLPLKILWFPDLAWSNAIWVNSAKLSSEKYRVSCETGWVKLYIWWSGLGS